MFDGPSEVGCAGAASDSHRQRVVARQSRGDGHARRRVGSGDVLAVLAAPVLGTMFLVAALEPGAHEHLLKWSISSWGFAEASTG